MKAARFYDKGDIRIEDIPEPTVAHHKTWSNDKYYEYGKTRMFVEFSKTF